MQWGGFRRSAVIVAAVALIAAACGGDDTGGSETTAAETTAAETTAAGQQLKVVFSMFDREAAFFRGCLAGVEAAAAEHNIDLILLLSGPDPNTQIQQVETAIQQEPDAIIISPADAAALAPVSAQAIAAGIPVFGVCDDWGSYGVEAGDSRLSYVGPDYALMGQLKAEAAFELAGGQGPVGRFYGVRGNSFDRASREGEERAFAANPDVEVIFGSYAGEYTATAGLEAAQNLMTGNPDIKAIICDQSDLCLGATQALTEMGYSPNDIGLTSNDGIAEELDAVREGWIDYTLAFCAYNQGTTIVQQVVDFVVNGVVPPELTIDVGREITPDNITADTPPVTDECAEPVFEVRIEAPKTELAEEIWANQS